MIDYLSRTMLIERLCGVGVYALALICTYYAMRGTRSYRKLCRILNTYLVILTVMGFFYIPAEAADIYRWRNISRNWHNLSLTEFFENYMVKTSYPMGMLMIYLCQKTEIKGVLPAVCAFLFHWNIFEILKMLCRKLGFTPRDLALPLLLFMSAGRFLEVISGIRCLVALSILARQVCEEQLDQRIRLRNLVWEMIAALIHPLALVLWGIRLAVLFVQRAGTARRKIANMCISAAAIFLGLRYGGRYIISAADKAMGFIESEIYFYSWEYIIVWLLWVLSVYILYFAHRINKNEKIVPIRNLIFFNSILVLIELVFCFEYSIFHRTISFSSMMILPVSAFLCRFSSNGKNRNTILIMSFLILLLACARGNLCGYKFFLLR